MTSKGCAQTLPLTLVVLVLIWTSCANADGVISFVTQHVAIQERQYEQAVFNLERNSGSSSVVFFYCEVLNSTGATDLVSAREPGQFGAGVTSSSCTFTVKEDNTPEPNITYTVGIRIQSGGATIGTPNIARLTVLANDDPFGVIGFEYVNQQIRALEPLEGQQSVASFNVLRRQGTIGTSVIFWQVSSGLLASVPEMSPNSGFLTFANGESTKKLNISIQPDQIPENDERYIIDLINATGGAMINSTSSRAFVIIPRNDPPIRFLQVMQSVSESQTLVVTVLRGLGEPGSSGTIGDISISSNVTYSTTDGSAKSGVDYQETTGILSFASRETSKSFSINILKDSHPEIAENFTVTLSNPSSGSVITPPYTLTVVIGKNDDPHGVISFQTPNAVLVLDEDSISSGAVYVNRSRGTFGTVTVDWRISSSGRSNFVTPSQVLNATHGVLTFKPGETTRAIPLSARQNSIPEEAMEFYVVLGNATGGARLDPTTPQTRVIVRDSDSAYGVVLLGNATEYRIELSSSPRRILLPVKRNRGAFGAVTVNVTAAYLLPGSSSPSSDVQLNYPSYVTLSTGSYNTTVEIQIAENSFLRKDAVFMVTLTSVQLQKQTIISSKTPVIGSPQTAFVNITSELANGEIAFFNNPVSVKVNEPRVGQVFNLSLLLMRDGVSGPATVSWRIIPTTSSFVVADALPWSGVVYFSTGADRANLTITILPDDTPEVDEVFTVELTNVTERNERLRVGGNRATVTINQNDSPGGTFEMNHTGRIILQENDARTVDVIRLGGALTTQRVQVTIVNGRNDFVTDESILKFDPNQRSKTFFIFTRDDTIPEENENFTMILTAIGDSILGTRTRLEIVILQNDDANGVFSFTNVTSNLFKYADEIKGSPHTVSFDITRSRGTFSTVRVYWNVTSLSGSHAASDLQQLNGVVEFAQGEASRPLNIRIRPDLIPEGEERFQIHLVNITGGGRFVEPLNATLIINPNDAPVYFLQPTHVTVNEGQAANLTIMLSRILTQTITVYVSTFDATASASTGDYVAALNLPVTFLPGEQRKNVSIQTINDDTPEIVEVFVVRLNGSTGDTVLIPPTEATVTIAANDDPYGIFDFSQASLNKIASEGDTVRFEILRSRGSFGNVSVEWEILYSNRRAVADNSEFVKATGNINFSEGFRSGFLSVVVRSDGVPELNETFYIRLTNVTGNFSQGGYLGNHTEATITVLPNDDPYGVIGFASSSMQVSVAEDYLPGLVNATHMNLTVQREKGTVGTIKTVWQLFEASNVPSQMWDFIFYGQRGNAVTQNAGRRYSGTPALTFNTSNASYVYVASQNQPTPIQIQSGFSISMWVKTMTTQLGVLISKRDSVTNDVIFKVSVVGSRAQILLQAKTALYNVSTSVNLLDGNWHSLILTISPSTLLVYVNGTQVDGPKTLTSAIDTASGHIYLGCNLPSLEHFTGELQDVRMYPSVLIPALVAEISSSRRVITPISGYLDYGPGVSIQHIFLSTIDNPIPEPETSYSVKIIGITGDGRLGSSSSSRVTILKSDNANGVFGFLSSSCQSSSSENKTNISFTVTRTVGSFGNVRLNWELRHSDGRKLLATDDFYAATGSITFSQGETSKLIVVRPVDDSVPEVNESFDLNLVSAVSTDGTVSSTPTSGASIKSDASKCNVTILANDNPNGVFQIMASRPNGTGFISPLSVPQSINVPEEIGRVNLYVVRAQGVQGRVGCDWKTNQISARGNVDFRDGVGSIVLQPGENMTTISIEIIDNKTPELEKMFNVQLYNPTGKAILGAAAYVNITIMPSDNAYGIFSFASESLRVRVSESPGAMAVLTVARQAGQLGSVNVTWGLLNGTSDFGLQSGSVSFANGQSVGQVMIPVLDDGIAELTERFTVQLISVTKGHLASQNTTATITISPNDDPYGVFQISSTPVRVQEQNATVSIVISRGGGDLGVVRVSYQTYIPAASSPGVTYATPNVDFIPVSSYVDFGRNQGSALINVTIKADSSPESDEYIMLNLTSVTLVTGEEVVANSPRLGASTTGTIIISENDDANGILQLSAAAVTLRESFNGYFLNVTRSAGTFGQVSVRFSVSSSSAVLGSDYQISSYNVMLRDRESTAALPMLILNDDIPEFNESFVVRLEESSLTGGAKLGNPKQCDVIILENDYPYGRIGFASGSLNVTISEPSSGQATVRLTVQRFGGTSGTAQVVWNATLGGLSASSDVTPATGTARFLSGENNQEIQLFVQADNIPEDNEAIRVTLISVTNGNAAIDDSLRTAVVNIPANDDPYGVVQFNQSSMVVTEMETDYFVNISVVRNRGLFGTIRLYYRTGTATSAHNQAISGGDFETVVGKSITMPPNIASGHVQVKILKDNVAEVDEQFLIEIYRAEVVGMPSGSSPNVRIGAPRVINVTIAANDQPYGLFGIYFKDTGTVGTTYHLIEPETGQSSVTFEIRRSQGVLGTVAVSWRSASGSSVNMSTDVAGASGGRFTFSPGESSKEITIAVNSDNIPESDESLIVELYSAEGGAVINSARQRATLIIMANDGVGGKIGFSPGSRSKTINEGQTVSLTIYRTAPAAGNVTLNWTIAGINATKDFRESNGKIFLKEGLTSTTLMITTLNDSTPENHETFTVQLADPITTGISHTGAGVLVPGDSTATIVIGASDEPHGVVEFATRAQPIRVTEDIGTVELRVVRIMGNIGDIAVHYLLRGAQISQTITAGTYGQDFNSTASSTLIIPDGKDSATIRVNIINDDIAEQDEAFYVNITDVKLVGGKNVTTPPKIGSLNYMQIQIEANDGTQGELAFASQFERINVPEDIGSFNITVIRHKGNFGNVYAFYYLNRLTASADDFDVPGGVMAGGPVKIAFANGERERNITVYITNDNITETDEQFELGLTIQNAVNNGGVKIGRPDKALVTIIANDDANGVLRFAERSITQNVTEPIGTPSTGNTATFYIERNIGYFGTVNLQWRVLGVNSSADVTPINGLITFEPNVREKNFQVSAVADNIPELKKTYIIQISIVSGGARVTSPSMATLNIAANDDPHGVLSVRALPSFASSINIEEKTKFINTVVRRQGGNLGKVTVQYLTRQGTALSTAGTNISFGYDQVLSTRSAESFHSFFAYGVQYLLLASSHRKKAVGSEVKSSVATEPFDSTLFRWQGSFFPLLSIDTDGATKWATFEDRNASYLVAINHGTNGRFEVMSQVMRMHRNLTIDFVQNIATKGASDVAFFRSGGSLYMVIANMKDNSGNTVQQLQLLRWQGSRFVLESASVETKGASALAVCTVNGLTHLVVANSYDSSMATYTTASRVYSWSDVNKRFSLVQSIQTHGATDVECTKIGNEHYLFFTNSKATSRLYRYKTTSPSGFVERQEINMQGARSGKFFKYNSTDYFVIAGNTSILYHWNNSTKGFQNVTNIPVQYTMNIQPFTATDAVAGELQYLAVTEGASSSSYLMRLAMLSETADFVPRRGQLTFYEGQTTLNLGLTVLLDSRPEMDESFSMDLELPHGDASLATSPNLAVTILSNDNAYGRMAFSDSSLRVNITEQSWDSVLRLNVLREYGSFGQVSLNWNITSMDGSTVVDLYPTSGQVNLNQGISSANILIYVRADGTPELNEEFRVSLTSVSIAGSAASNRGPTINHLKSSSIVTILANNDPYGVVSWKNRFEITTEEKEVNSSAVLILSRAFGALGDIMVAYETQQAVNVSRNERKATPGVDYFTQKSTVLIRQGVKEAIVYIKVRHKEKMSEILAHSNPDNDTSVNEIFNVNITDVYLVSGAPVRNSPRIDQNKRLTEVVITEAILNRGSVEFESPIVRRVSENSGVISLNLVRSNGTQGSVGVHFVINLKNASYNDFAPKSGLVTLSHNTTRATLTITIVNDNLPELDESLDVTLIKPAGGVKIGQKRTVEVIITQNDFPYGLLSFNSGSRVVTGVNEGQIVQLKVDRTQGLYRTVIVDWSCGSAAQSDLTPWQGTLTFAENVTVATITIQTLNDTIPELTEQFTCSLSNPQNGAAISEHNNATISIVPSDKPYGIISIAAASRNLVVAEPMTGYNGVFSISILRSIGFDGQVSAQWRLGAVAGTDNTNSTFNVTSGVVVFPSGVSTQRVYLRVLDDSTPEESKKYFLYVERTSGGAELDIPANTRANITVASSDHPYGTVQFSLPLRFNVSESAGRVNVTVTRTGGQIGQLHVSYTSTGSTATPGVDFSPVQGVITFNPGEGVKTIQLNVIDDSIPELSETIALNISSVRVVTSKELNLQVVNGLQVDTPPTIGVNSQIEITIDANDQPYGEIRFLDRQRLVHESDGRVPIAVNRTGGTFGTSIVYYTYAAGSANSPADFVVSGSSLTFAPGEKQQSIPVQIVDDPTSEFQETFQLRLTSISGPANLGSITTLNITIETSDNPYGLFGVFNTSLSITVPNPNTTIPLSFPLSRKDGALGRSEVSWRVVRNTASASAVAQDITPDSGTTLFEPNQRGPKMINVTILTAGGPQEPEEDFTLQVYGATGGAALDHAFTNVSIIILKKGHPNGLFRFTGTVFPSAIVAEPETGTTTVTVPVRRDFGTTGAVNVLWSVASSSGSTSLDLGSMSTSLNFSNGQKTGNIVLAVLSDNIPELDEVFELTLVSASNGADINNARRSINFTIRANDYPHGLFSIDQTNSRFEFNPSTLDRRLNFSIVRARGTIGVVRVNIGIQYSEGGASDSHSVTFSSGQNKVSTVFGILKERFLTFGANFSVKLQSVAIIGSGSTMAPEINSTSPSLVIVIPEGAANSVIDFDSDTRYPTASTSFLVQNVRISRRGLLGTNTVQWRSGYPGSSLTIGSISPSQGTVSFAQGERTKSLSFQVQVPSVIANRMVYAVYLSSVSPAQGEPAWPKIGSATTAVVDPHGVVEISPSSLNVTVVEGNRAAIVVRRLLSTIGTIQVSYTTQRYIGSNSATEGVDFTAVTSTFNMIEGQTTETINIDTIDDSGNVAERDEFFFVALTSVRPVTTRLSASSPRLSSSSDRATVRIRDNDNPFGVISFKTQTVQTSESAGRALLTVQRTGGVFSTVTVLARSIGGGESWQDSVISSLPASSPVRVALNARTRPASAVSPNQDYQPLNTKIVFEELNSIPAGGQIKTVNISIMPDALAEPAEQILVLLTNPTGGATLPSSSASLKDFSVITINENGLWNGKIGFSVNVAEINEDQTAQVFLPLRRTGSAIERIEVKWQVWSTAANIAQQFVSSSGSAFFEANNLTSSIMIQLKKDQTPEFASWFTVNLTTTAPGAIIAVAEPGLFSACNVTMLESDYPAGRIGFNDRYRFPVVTLNDVSKDIRIRRYGGTLKDVTVKYQTVSLVSPIYDGDIVYTPARENQDYQSAAGQVSFPKGSTEAIINIKLTPSTASAGAYPKVFNITLMSPTGGAIIYNMYSTDQIIISKDSAAATFLRLRASAWRIPLTDREIENIFTEMLQLVKVPPLSASNQELLIKTIRSIISYKTSLPAGQRSLFELDAKVEDNATNLTNNSKSLLLDVYDSLLSPSRTDTSGKSSWATLLDDLAYNFLEDMSCPYTFSGRKSNFALTSRRDRGSNLNGVNFASGRNADFFRYPVNMFSSTGSTPCTDIHFIDYGNQKFFSSGKSVLNNKVMSSKIKTGLSSGMKVVFRIHTSNSRVTQTGASCVIWQHPSAGSKGDWNSRNCNIRGQSKSYVECECRHLSEYAVLALSDNRTGYEIYFYVSCYFTIGACLLALLAHHVCSYETTFTSNLLMHFIFAVMMTNILYVVAAHISPTLVDKTTDCGALALAIHYFFLAQFTWMFAQGCNLWRILIMNDEHTDRKFLHFFVMAWGLPVLVIVGYILVTYAAYRWPFSKMYGDVNGNGDMCFMSNGFAALGSVIIPVILFVLGVAVVFVQSYQVKPQWQCYDDVYRGRYNVKELRHYIAMFALVTLKWLFAGLHLSYGYLWMIIIFTVLNFILGLYILVIYAILRNDMRYLFHGEYAVRKMSSGLIPEHELIYAPNSLNHSGRKLIDTRSDRSNNLSEWEDVELPATLNPMDFPDKAAILDSPDLGASRGQVNESYDIDSDEFDDLIFALKTGGPLTQNLPDEQELEEKIVTPRPTSADQPQVRRIKIADTHL